MKKMVISAIFIASIFSNLANAEDCVIAKELNVQFKNDSVVFIDVSENQKLKEFASFIVETNLYTLIEGHTNSISTARYNYTLSTNRANTVRSGLISLGIDSKSIRSMGFGESSPLYSNSDDGLDKNRRVVANVFNTEKELANYISLEKKRIKNIKFKEQL